MSANTAACHARFAAACAINELVNERPAGAVAETWGASGIFKGGEPGGVRKLGGMKPEAMLGSYDSDQRGDGRDCGA